MCILSYFCRWNRVCTKTTLPLYHLLFSCLNVLIPPPSWSPGNKCTSNLTWIDATELTPPLLCCVYNIAWKSHLVFVKNSFGFFCSHLYKTVKCLWTLTSTSGLLRMSSTLARSPLAAALTSSSLMSPDSCVSNSFFSNWDRRSNQTRGKHQTSVCVWEIGKKGSREDKEHRQACVRSAFLYKPPEALLTAEPEGAILVTAAGLYVQEVPQTSTFRSLSE